MTDKIASIYNIAFCFEYRYFSPLIEFHSFYSFYIIQSFKPIAFSKLYRDINIKKSITSSPINVFNSYFLTFIFIIILVPILSSSYRFYPYFKFLLYILLSTIQLFSTSAAILYKWILPSWKFLIVCIWTIGIVHKLVRLFIDLDKICW